MDISLLQPANSFWAPRDKGENGIIPALQDITLQWEKTDIGNRDLETSKAFWKTIVLPILHGKKPAKS